MRLLNTKSMQVEFHVNPPKIYAILSHTWGHQEVLYEDIKSEDGGRSKEGFKKVENCCKLALSEGYDLVWIDTCCIDKSSSAELSEAINSMFDWYQSSDTCYTFLEDFSPTEAPVEGFLHNDWRYCKYFTRGWTLQELLASYTLNFYDRNWRYFATKLDIADELATELGIEPKVLKHQYIPHRNEYSIANRMSWASKRETSRPEDIAYCLLGIFGVNMPLLYGEGSTKAFLRLQEEIIRISNDESIFAWANKDFDDRPQITQGKGGVLAESPASFAEASKIVPFQTDNQPYSMTNIGLSISLPVLPLKSLPSLLGGKFPAWLDTPEYAVLNCYYHDDFRGPLCLELLPRGRNSNRFTRSSRKPFRIKSSLAAKAEKRLIFISRFDFDSADYPNAGSDYNYFWVRTKIGHKYLKNQPFRFQGFPPEFWNTESAVLSVPNNREVWGAALVTIGEELDQPLRFAVIFQAAPQIFYKLFRGVFLLLPSEFDEHCHSIDEYAKRLKKESDAIDSLELSNDVQVVAKVKTEEIMGEQVNVIELLVNYQTIMLRMK